MTTMSTDTQPDEQPTLRLAYTRKEVADLIGVSVRTVDRWISSGHLDSIKVGARGRRIPAKALHTYLAENTERATR